MNILFRSIEEIININRIKCLFGFHSYKCYTANFSKPNKDLGYGKIKIYYFKCTICGNKKSAIVSKV